MDASQAEQLQTIPTSDVFSAAPHLEIQSPSRTPALLHRPRSLRPPRSYSCDQTARLAFGLRSPGRNFSYMRDPTGPCKPTQFVDSICTAAAESSRCRIQFPSSLVNPSWLSSRTPSRTISSTSRSARFGTTTLNTHFLDGEGLILQPAGIFAWNLQVLAANCRDVAGGDCAATGIGIATRRNDARIDFTSCISEPRFQLTSLGRSEEVIVSGVTTLVFCAFVRRIAAFRRGLSSLSMHALDGRHIREQSFSRITRNLHQ